MAAARQPNMRVLLVGEETDKITLPVELQPITKALGVRRDMPRIMRALDILVSSSAYGEGLPNVVAEAMASGVPCVVTDVGDSAVLVGGDGVVVPPRDPGALARGMEVLMTKPAAELNAMAARGREHVNSDYSIASSLRRYSELFSGKAGV
jgi:glycosyltransferase involved in cell wall biosynthesis